MKWLFSRFAIRISPITHLVLPPTRPLKKKCATLIFHFSWVLQPSQEKLKIMLMQNWREASCVMSLNCNGQEPCYGSTIKISLNPFWVLARECTVPQKIPRMHRK